MPGEIRVRVVPGDVVVDDGALAVNIAGQVQPVWWPAGYIPTAGDTVQVIVTDGRAYVLGPTVGEARPGGGTVSGAAVGGLVPVTTPTGTVQARYTGTAPSPGTAIFLDWQSTTPRILSGAAAAATGGSSSGGGTPTTPGQTAAGTLNALAITSSTWGSASGWNRYSDSVRQWRYGSESPSMGAWFYGARVAAIRGATVTAAAVYVPARERVGAYNAAGALRLYRHTSATRPASSDVVRVGSPTSITLPGGWGGGWVTIPTSLAQTLVDSGGGLAIAGAPYLGLVGLSRAPASGQLRLNWRR